MLLSFGEKVILIGYGGQTSGLLGGQVRDYYKGVLYKIRVFEIRVRARCGDKGWVMYIC